MKRFCISIGLLAAIVVDPTSPAARADTLNFDRSCGDIFWHTCCGPEAGIKSNNWDVPSPPAPLCPVLPAPADDVFVEGDCTIEPAMTGTALTLTQSDGTFTVEGGLEIAAEAMFDGPLVWNSGSIARSGGAGTQQAVANGGLTIQGDEPKVLSYFGGFRLINPASGEWTGSGTWTIGMIPGATAPSVFENPAGATFTVSTDAAVVQTEYGLGLIENEGTIIKSGASGVSDWKVTLVNDGLIHVQEGELLLTGSGEGSGEFRIDAGATLTFGTVFSFEFKPGIRFTGDGEVVVANLGSSTAILVRDTIDLDRFRVDAGGIIGPTNEFGHINVTGLLQLDGGAISPSVTVLPGARLEHTGPNESFVGDLSIEGDAEILQGTLSTRDKTITVQPDGVVEIHDGAALRTAGLVNLPIQNNGTIQKTTGEGTAFVLADFFELFFNNAGGLVHVASGTLDFAESNIVTEGGDWQVDTGTTLLALGSFGQIFQLNSGSVRGGGTVVVRSLNNNGGVVSPGDSAGILTIAANVEQERPGDYVQAAGGTLEIEVGGLTPGMGHDQLAVAGTATLNGSVTVSLLDGFIPATDDTVTILTAASVIGEFAEIVPADFPDGLTVEAEYSPTAVVVRFTNMIPDDPEDGGGGDGDGGDDGGSDSDDGGSGSDGEGDGEDGGPATGGGGGRAGGSGFCAVGVGPVVLLLCLGWLSAVQVRRHRRSVGRDVKY